MASSSSPTPVFAPAAALLAWLWPGLGHISLGEKRRGWLIMFGVLFLYGCGILIGGIDAVDRKNDKLWFTAQSLCGPVVFATDLVNQRAVQRGLPDRFERGTPGRLAYEQQDLATLKALRRVGIGHVNEVGTLFVALAGLMNLVVILDALYFIPPERRAAHGLAAAESS